MSSLFAIEFIEPLDHVVRTGTFHNWLCTCGCRAGAHVDLSKECTVCPSCTGFQRSPIQRARVEDLKPGCFVHVKEPLGPGVWCELLEAVEPRPEGFLRFLWIKRPVGRGIHMTRAGVEMEYSATNPDAPETPDAQEP